jgi:hypothetical protein
VAGHIVVKDSCLLPEKAEKTQCNAIKFAEQAFTITGLRTFPVMPRNKKIVASWCTCNTVTRGAASQLHMGLSMVATSQPHGAATTLKLRLLHFNLCSYCRSKWHVMAHVTLAGRAHSSSTKPTPATLAQVTTDNSKETIVLIINHNSLHIAVQFMIRLHTMS